MAAAAIESSKPAAPARRLPSEGTTLSLLLFVLRGTWRDQAILVTATAASLPFYYLSLETAKMLVNDVLLARSADEVVTLNLPVFGAYTATARGLLVNLSLALLASVLVHGLLKMFVNIYKGGLTERVLAHMRRTLLEMADDSAQAKVAALHGRLTPMVVMEPEPIGGFCGDLLALPAVQGGLLATALVFIFAQDWLLGTAALVLFPLQAWLFPKLVARRTALELERVEHIRLLSLDIESEVERRLSGAPARQLAKLPSAQMHSRIDAIRRNRVAFYTNKFFTYFFLNFANQFTAFLFYAIGGWFVLEGKVSVGALVAVIAAYRDLTPPWEEVLYWWQDSKVAIGRYRSLLRQFQ